MVDVGQVWQILFHSQTNCERLAVTTFVEKNSKAASDLAERSGTINEGYLPNCGREGICHLWGDVPII